VKTGEYVKMKRFQKDGNQERKSSSGEQPDQPCQQDGNTQASSEANQPEQIFQKDGSHGESFQENEQNFQREGSQDESFKENESKTTTTTQEVKNNIMYKKDDIRFHVVREREGQAELRASREPSNHQEGTSKSKRGEKMRQMRTKMTLTRQKAETHRERNKILIKIRKPQTYRGQAIVDSKDAKSEEIQEDNELVVVGSDVEGLYPAIDDVEAAVLCYNALMESEIKNSKRRNNARCEC
jgi:hypothetical protein